MGGQEAFEVTQVHKKFNVPGFLHKLHNYPADVRGTSTWTPSLGEIQLTQAFAFDNSVSDECLFRQTIGADSPNR